MNSYLELNFKDYKEQRQKRICYIVIAVHSPSGILDLWKMDQINSYLILFISSSCRYINRFSILFYNFCSA